MGAKNRVKLKIADCEILVASEDSEEYMIKTGSMVNDYITDIMKNAPSMSTTLAAIFAALEFCDESSKAKKSADNLRVQIKDALDESARMREELENAKKSEKEIREELNAIKTANGLKALQEELKSDEK